MQKSHGLDSGLLEFLGRRESYPHHPNTVKHIQTHISHVFMVPPLVYKIKKPVDFEFLDYSSLEKRRRLCHREVELNRRLCEGVYLGVVAIVKEEGHYRFTDENKTKSVVEYAVRMRELSEEHFLHHYIDEGTLSSDHLDRVAKKLTDFYMNQEIDENIAKWGRIENIRVNTDENFRQTKEFIDQTIEQHTFDAIQTFTNQYYEKHDTLFAQRIEDGRIVDGHGDLHLEHIHITPDQVRIYDCIEFNDRFRYGDLAADLAYLAMDLDFNDCWQQGRYFIDRMSRELDDSDLLQIIDFYKCYRAYVKGKVKSLQSAEEEVEPEERAQAADLAGRYFNLSLRYALLGSKPVVLVFMGRVGTGKSTLAKQIAEKLNLAYFSSDCIRKEMAGVPLTKRVSSSEREKLYSAEMSEKTYDKIRKKAVQKIEEGESVILDATFSHKAGRQKLVTQLEGTNGDYCFVEIQASNKVIKDRLMARQAQEDVISDARLEDFEMLNEKYNPPCELAGDRLIEIDSERAVGESTCQLYEKLVARHINR